MLPEATNGSLTLELRRYGSRPPLDPEDEHAPNTGKILPVSVNHEAIFLRNYLLYIVTTKEIMGKAHIARGDII